MICKYSLLMKMMIVIKFFSSFNTNIQLQTSLIIIIVVVMIKFFRVDFLEMLENLKFGQKCRRYAAKKTFSVSLCFQPKEKGLRRSRDDEML